MRTSRSQWFPGNPGSKGTSENQPVLWFSGTRVPREPVRTRRFHWFLGTPSSLGSSETRLFYRVPVDPVPRGNSICQAGPLVKECVNLLYNFIMGEWTSFLTVIKCEWSSWKKCLRGKAYRLSNRKIDRYKGTDQ